MLLLVAVSTAGCLALNVTGVSFFHAHCSDNTHENDEKELEQMKRKATIRQAQMSRINYNECLLIQNALEKNDSWSVPQIKQDAYEARQHFEGNKLVNTMTTVLSNSAETGDLILLGRSTFANPTLDSVPYWLHFIKNAQGKQPDHIQKFHDDAKKLIMDGYDPKECEKFKLLTAFKTTIKTAATEEEHVCLPPAVSAQIVFWFGCFDH
jgi:hypothetical protein